VQITLVVVQAVAVEILQQTMVQVVQAEAH
jgi:hypothetical protein